MKSRAPPRRGRPPNTAAGVTEERLLDAAMTMFFQHGFSGASLGRIAKVAGASKATLYRRYSCKEELFSEVVRRSCERLHLPYDVPKSVALSHRLVLTTEAHLKRLLSDEVVGLIRIVVAEAPRFLSLAKLTSDAYRSRAIDAIATMIAAHSEHPLDARATSDLHSHVLATELLDAIVSPMVVRALMEENLVGVRNATRSHVKQVIAVFVAANALSDFL